MIAAIYNFEIEQGSTFETYFTISETTLDLTEYDLIRMQIRRVPGSPVIWNSEDSDPGGVIEIENATTIHLKLDSDTTTKFRFENAGYDIELVKTGFTPNIVDKILKGVIVLKKEYTS